MKKGEAKKLYYQEMRYAKNKRKYTWHEGRKKAYYIFRCCWNDNDELQSITRYTTKYRPDKKAKLRGPDDLKETAEFQGILDGKELEYPYLSDIKIKALTMRALGVSRAKIARALSGGGKSYKTSTIKHILQTARQEVRENKKMGMSKKKVSVDLWESTVRETDRIAEHTGKTRTRIIHEALIEYIYENAPPDIWKTEHFEVGFNKFNEMRKRIQDIENYHWEKGVKPEEIYLQEPD